MIARYTSWQGWEPRSSTSPFQALLAEVAAANGWIISAESYAALADLVDDPAQPLDEAVRRRARAGAAISSRAYLADLAERERAKVLVAEAMRDIDALLTPTTETAAPALSDIDQAASPTRFTRWANFLDLLRPLGPQRLHGERLACPPRCRSSAPPTTRRPRCASAGLGRPPPTGTPGCRRWRTNHGSELGANLSDRRVSPASTGEAGRFAAFGRPKSEGCRRDAGGRSESPPARLV